MMLVSLHGRKCLAVFGQHQKAILSAAQEVAVDLQQRKVRFVVDDAIADQRYQKPAVHLQARSIGSERLPITAKCFEWKTFRLR